MPLNQLSWGKILGTYHRWNPALVFASGMLPASQEQPDDSWVDGNVTLVLTKDGKTVELPFDYV